MTGALAVVCALMGLAAATADTRSLAAKPTVLSSYTGKRGKQLVVELNRQKLTLYNFSEDHGKSACYGRCQKVWYPLIDHGRVIAGSRSQVKAYELGTTRRRNGSLQITYYGQPLYRCHRNTATGQIYGADSYQFGGSWGVMNVKGNSLPPTSYGGSKPVPEC
jgi:predicted lipoprotein with Yx(FWY)xxD motif